MCRTLVLTLLAVILLAACGDTTAPVELVTADRAVAARSAPPTTSLWVMPPPPTTTTTTTTTAPPPPLVSTTTTMPPSPTPPPAGGGHVNGYPCGGDLPPCWVLERESGGDPTAVNPTGCGGYTCGGLWQFDPRTWDGYGGFTYAQDAPADVQNDRARQVWAGGAGCSHWDACNR